KPVSNASSCADTSARAVPESDGDLLALLVRSCRARGRAGDGPFVLVHRNGALGLRPELDGDVIDSVAEDARLDGQVAHALAEPFLTADGTALDHQAGRLAHSFEDADLRTQRIH